MYRDPEFLYLIVCLCSPFFLLVNNMSIHARFACLDILGTVITRTNAHSAHTQEHHTFFSVIHVQYVTRIIMHMSHAQ
jgi:hypothetical protein